MRSPSVLAVIAAAAFSGWWGCASAPHAPYGWLPSPEEAQRDPHGGWIEAEFAGVDGQVHEMEGELLAVDEEQLHVAAGATVLSVARDSVTTARLTYFDPHAGRVAALTLVGTIATIGNGVMLIFTAPAWIIVGTSATAQRSRAGSVTESDAGWDELRWYARFPQGLPSTFGGVPPGPPASTPTAPVALEPRAPPATAYWFDMAVGGGFHSESTGAAFVFGGNLAYHAFMTGTRFSVVQREASTHFGADESYTSGETFDLALLLGLRRTYRSLHVSASVGPAAYAFSIGDLVDFHGSMAAQAELFYVTGHHVAIGTVLAGNWNDVRNFYVISFGIALGIR